MRSRPSLVFAPAVAVFVCSISAHAMAADSQAEIAKKLNNPIAALISVPLQLNFDGDIGSGDEGEHRVLNIQPVIPITLNEDWNVISRTILPLIERQDVPPGNDDSGIGDVVQSLFFSPKAPTASGWIWGAGPVFLLPTASEQRLGAEQWAAGPTAVVLKQDHGWTYGALANHLWSYAGEGDRADVNATFLQPFVAYTTPKFTTYSVNTESTYDWESKDWSIPINLSATQLFKIGEQPMSLQFGVRYWADSPDAAPEGWGARFVYTLVIPK